MAGKGIDRVDGIATISQRIAHIQTQIAAVRAPLVARPGPLGQGAGQVLGQGAVRDTAPPSAALFSQVLEQAVSSRSVVPGSTALTAAPARLNADGIPVDLAAYGNGKIPASALSTIAGTSHRMWAPAAQAYEQLSAAAAREGVTIGITDSYRSYESQVDVAQRKGLYSQGGLAAVPGTSDHGWGRSLDLALDGKAQSWMRANAGRYGFVEDVPRESWHWTYAP